MACNVDQRFGRLAGSGLNASEGDFDDFTSRLAKGVAEVRLLQPTAECRFADASFDGGRRVGPLRQQCGDRCFLLAGEARVSSCEMESRGNNSELT